MSVYVLACGGGNYYVGWTSQVVSARLAQHRHGTGSAWTALHGVVELLRSAPGTKLDEDSETLRMMYEHGIDKVRGGPYVTVTLPSSVVAGIRLRLRMAFPVCGTCGGDHPSRFCRGPTNDTALTPEVRRELVAAARALPDYAAALDATHGLNGAASTIAIARLIVHYGVEPAVVTSAWITKYHPERVQAAFVHLQDAACYDELPELLDPEALHTPDGSIARYVAMRRLLDALGWRLLGAADPIPAKRLQILFAAASRSAPYTMESANAILREYMCALTHVAVPNSKGDGKRSKLRAYTLTHSGLGKLFRLVDGRVTL